MAFLVLADSLDLIFPSLITIVLCPYLDLIGGNIFTLP